MLNFRSWLAIKEKARGLLAKMLGGRPEQVAFVRNTSDALSTVANGYRWHSGDNLVTFRNEFPSNIYPWLRAREAFGIEIRMCDERRGRIDLDELIGLIDHKTRLVAISHVQYASGFRTDLERLGRAVRHHDALLVVDVIQSLGVVPIEVESELIDVAAGACHKWVAAITDYLERLTDELTERLRMAGYDLISSRAPGEKSQIVCIRHRGSLSPMDLFVHLKKQNIITAPRGDGLRIAPHFCNTAEEITALVNALP